jgi:NADPH:quinone reductase-like Zn-dependent oxidoreductase
MKAIIFDERELLHIENIAIPIPNDNELLVKIIVSGFNPIDYQMRENKQENKRLHSPVLGREFSGVVTGIGKNVKDFKPGDAVFCGSGSMGSNGTYAEYITVPESIVALKPDSISFQQAAALPSVGLTALQCLHRMKLEPTDTVFITGGAGGVGTMFLKMLLAKQFQNFVVTAGNPESIASLLEIGVNENQIINYHQDDVINEAVARNNNQAFDYVVDLVGNKMSEIAGKVIKTNGTYVDVTAGSTSTARGFLFNKGANIFNISNYVYSLDQDYAYFKNGLNELVNLIEYTSVTPPVIKIVGPLSINTVEIAHSQMRNNQTKGKKLVMQVSTEK